MSSIEIVLTIISVAGTLSSIMFAYLAFKRGNKTENKAEGKNEGVLISDIYHDTILNTTNFLE
jgi:hypothetical protein